jgi:hypothetical protein
MIAYRFDDLSEAHRQRVEERIRAEPGSRPQQVFRSIGRGPHEAATPATRIERAPFSTAEVLNFSRC